MFSHRTESYNLYVTEHTGHWVGNNMLEVLNLAGTKFLEFREIDLSVENFVPSKQHWFPCLRNSIPNNICSVNWYYILGVSPGDYRLLYILFHSSERSPNIQIMTKSFLFDWKVFFSPRGVLHLQNAIQSQNRDIWYLRRFCISRKLVPAKSNNLRALFWTF